MKKEASRFWVEVLMTDEKLTCICPFCHRVNFASANPQAYEKGVLEDLVDRRDKDGFHEQASANTLTVGVIEGEEVVFGCQCRRLESIEGWVWNSRYLILSYLSLRAEAEMEDSQLVIGKGAAVAAKLGGLV
jgi:hypothetical protein